MSKEVSEKKGMNWGKSCGLGCLGLIGLFVVLGAIGSMMGDSTTSNSSTSSSSTDTSAAPQQEQSKEIAKIGQPAQDGDLVFTVQDVKTAPTLGSNQYVRTTAQGIFQVLTIKIENVGKNTQTIDSSSFTLTDSQGRTFDRSVEAQTALTLGGSPDFFLQQVQPGLSVTGQLAFDVPKDAGGFVLKARSGFFSLGTEIRLER